MSVKFTLLALLYQRPMHGYELGKQFTTIIDADWDVKPGQIASTLARMKEGGLVDYHIAESSDAPDRKVYSITEEGRHDLEMWYRTPEVRDYRLSDTFYIKLVLSLMNGPVPPEEVLAAQRRELYQQLHNVTDMLRKAEARKQLPWVLLLESATMHVEADLRWIEMCETHLPDLKHYTPPKPLSKPRGRPRRSDTAVTSEYTLHDSAND
jgi:DNA-binding PadR family transcriptional regulator